MRSIYHRKDGRFEGRIADISADGSKKYISVYGRTVEEAEAKINAIKSHNQAFLASRMGGNNGELTIRTLFYNWLEVAAIRVKESSLANYRMKIEKHIIPNFGDLLCCELTVEMVQSFISEKLKCGLSPKYVADIVILMKSVFRHASRTRGLPNPLEYVELPKRKSTEVKLLSRNQQKTLQTYLLNNMSLSSLGILLCFYTGLRIGELCALKWADIDFENGVINVSRTIQRIQNSGRNGIKCGTKLIITEPKSASSMRKIPIPDVILPYLLKYKSEAEFFVLSGSIKPVEPRVMQYRFAAVLKKADLPSVHFHALRHMFASNCIAYGFDVKSLSEILGHSSVDITLNRYVHSSMEQKRKFMSKLNFAA